MILPPRHRKQGAHTKGVSQSSCGAVRFGGCGDSGALFWALPPSQRVTWGHGSTQSLVPSGWAPSALRPAWCRRQLLALWSTTEHSPTWSQPLGEVNGNWSEQELFPNRVYLSKRCCSLSILLAFPTPGAVGQHHSIRKGTEWSHPSLRGDRDTSSTGGPVTWDTPDFLPAAPLM